MIIVCFANTESTFFHLFFYFFNVYKDKNVFVLCRFKSHYALSIGQNNHDCFFYN